MLFGFQLSLTDLAAVGWQALVADVLTIAVILPLGIWLGRKVLKLSAVTGSIAGHRQRGLWGGSDSGDGTGAGTLSA